MPVILDLSEQEIAELKVFTNQTEPTAAAYSAIIDYLRLARRLQLKSLSGRVAMPDNSQALGAAKLLNSDYNSPPDSN